MKNRLAGEEGNLCVWGGREGERENLKLVGWLGPGWALWLGHSSWTSPAVHSDPFLLIFGGLFAAGAAGSGIPVTHAPSLWVPGLSELVLPHSWRIEEVMVFQG